MPRLEFVVVGHDDGHGVLVVQEVVDGAVRAPVVAVLVPVDVGQVLVGVEQVLVGVAQALVDVALVLVEIVVVAEVAVDTVAEELAKKTKH